MSTLTAATSRVTLVSADGSEKLTLVTTIAGPPMSADKRHTWVEHLRPEGYSVQGMHEWHDDEFKAQAYVEAQIKEALAKGWQR